MAPPEATADVDDDDDEIAAPAVRTTSKTRRAVRLRRWAARALLFVPPLAVIALDLARRRARYYSYQGT